MKISELTKTELCELIMSLQGASAFSLRYKIDEFLRQRWERKRKKLLAEFDKVDIMKDFARFERINKELDKLHNNADYYLRLDEPTGGKR